MLVQAYARYLEARHQVLFAVRNSLKRSIKLKT